MLRVGVIGTGDWGQKHLRIYSELDCELVGLADINPARKALSDKYNIKFFTDYKELLPLVDVVSVVVPTDKHYAVVKECLMNGKHVLVEKPITSDSKTGEELVNLAKAKGLLLAVGYLFRFNAAVNLLKEEIKNIGDIQYITARYIHSNKPPRKDSGVIFNFGIHLIDILNYVLDKKPLTVFCKRMNYLSPEREDGAFIMLGYDRFIANLEMSWFHPLKERDIWVIGSKAKLHADLFEQIVVKYPIEIGYDKTIALPPVNLEVNKNEPLKEELTAFIRTVQTKIVDKKVKFKGEEEILTTKICELAFVSSKLNKEMNVNE
jgi:UDP-N-acetylglucosamine 3-dehydrogenase